MSRLSGKVAIITGGAAGIGLATGALFAHEGANVLLVDIDEQALRKAVDSIAGDSVSCAVADVTQPDQVRRYVGTAVQRYGGIDVFINNAGIEGQIKPVTEYPIETFDKVMAVNVRGVWLGLKYVIPEMKKRGGSIVITSSMAGVSGGAGLSPYMASKHAVIGIMRSVAQECAALGIRVNTVNPGFTDTRLVRSLEQQRPSSTPEEAKKSFIDRIALKRYAQPREIANLMLFLASDESSYCTGGVYMADGGVTKVN